VDPYTRSSRIVRSIPLQHSDGNSIVIRPSMSTCYPRAGAAALSEWDWTACYY